MDHSNRSVSSASFRDPAGYVFEEGGLIKRAVTHHGASDYDQFIASGLYDELVKERLIVSHDEIPLPSDSPQDIHRILVPEQVPFVSYPYEWSFGQLRDAAVLTLKIEQIALEFGMSLKDASAFNVQFRGPRPVFIDTLSFEQNEVGPWVGYGQFCRHFLAPLLLMAQVDPTFNRFMTASIDGIALPLTSSLLPKSSYLNFGTFLHIHLHGRSERKYADATDTDGTAKLAEASGPDRKASLLESLMSAVKGIRLKKVDTEWAEYYKEADHYSNEAEQEKKRTVTRFIERVAPQLVYDLGGNIGEYSRLATGQSIDTVCFDIDPLCVHRNYERSKGSGDQHMLPLMADLSNPIPALGFALKERFSFLERPKPDLVMVLALIHHLRITCNVPLSHLADFFAGLSKHVVMEFVPKDDVMVRALLRNRKDTFHDYDTEGFLLAFKKRFNIQEAAMVPGTARTLYLLERLS